MNIESIQTKFTDYSNKMDLSMEPVQEFDSGWKWITWAVMLLLFFVYYHYAQALKEHLFPNTISDRSKRQLFDFGSVAGGIVMFLFIWAYVLEWIYNG